jgi:3-dehydroquinate synthase
VRTFRLLGQPVYSGAGALRQLGEICRAVAPATTYALVTDSGVAPHWLEPARAALEAAPSRVLTEVVPAGENSKTREEWAHLTDRLLSQGCGRDTTVVALGGGMVGDLAGFVAATYMRGLPLIQVPTTLLAMVDASLGGKVAVDTPAGKNLVGAFYPPAAVVIDSSTLTTLPARQIRAGFAEILKHGAIADANFFAMAAAAAKTVAAALSSGERPDWSEPELLQVIERAAAIKGEIVAADPLERGRRALLNFGHTVGHALEHASGYRLLHGEAVAIGLACEAQLGERIGATLPGTAQALSRALEAAGLPTAFPPGSSLTALLEAMRADKKQRRGHIHFSLISAIGRPVGDDSSGWTVPVPLETVSAVLSEQGAAE